MAQAEESRDMVVVENAIVVAGEYEEMREQRPYRWRPIIQQISQRYGCEVDDVDQMPHSSPPVFATHYERVCQRRDAGSRSAALPFWESRGCKASESLESCQKFRVVDRRLRLDLGNITTWLL